VNVWFVSVIVGRTDTTADSLVLLLTEVLVDFRVSTRSAVWLRMRVRD
jgi:hypothetical protein